MPDMFGGGGSAVWGLKVYFFGKNPFWKRWCFTALSMEFLSRFNRRSTISSLAQLLATISLNWSQRRSCRVNSNHCFLCHGRWKQLLCLHISKIHTTDNIKKITILSPSISVCPLAPKHHISTNPVEIFVSPTLHRSSLVTIILVIFLMSFPATASCPPLTCDQVRHN